MAMFPIFMIGLFVGGIVGYTFSVYEKDNPSATKLHLQEANIISLKEDVRLLEECILKKDDTIKQLKQDIQSFEERK